MTEPTPQSLGYLWDKELAALIGGKAHPGSGNGVHLKLDASGHSLIFSGKHTMNASTSLKETDLDEALRAAVGPGAATTGLIPVMAYKFGQTGRMVAALDLMQLLAWIKSPPELVPATKGESLRATARTPSLLRNP